MHITFVGLKTCDTCKTARKWLDGQGIAYDVVDVRADGVRPAALKAWMNAHGAWEPFLNRRGTTWRRLPEADKVDLDRARSIALIAAHPTLLKRPVMVIKDGGETTVTVGFGAEQQRLLAARR